MSKNNITGDEIKSRAFSDEGRRNWEKIFSKKTEKDWAIFDNESPEGLNADDLIKYSEFKKSFESSVLKQFGEIEDFKVFAGDNFGGSPRQFENAMVDMLEGERKELRDC